MKKWTKPVLFIGGIIAIAGASFAVYVFNKPHRDVTNEKAVQLTAEKIYAEFKINEEAANKKYLDKAIQLSGEVSNVTTNQDGQTVVDFKTSDSLVFINCTFKTNPGTLKPGNTITFKGICTGYIPDANVVINEGVLIK